MYETASAAVEFLMLCIPIIGITIFLIYFVFLLGSEIWTSNLEKFFV